MKNYYSNNIPPELIEAAEMDGAGEYKVFFKIILPLSLPIMATVGLMIGIGYWNDWTNGLYYLTDQNLFSLQNVLNSILTNIQFLSTSNVSQKVTTELPSTSVRMAIAVVGMLPILVLYPFFQRYFVKGITIGSVKG
ncbi:L-arabinose transport system permease protein AraQ [compost metagenome]